MLTTSLKLHATMMTVIALRGIWNCKRTNHVAVGIKELTFHGGSAHAHYNVNQPFAPLQVHNEHERLGTRLVYELMCWYFVDYYIYLKISRFIG